MAHSCLSCSPGPDRVVDHHRGVLNVPRGYRGPPESVHGGAAAGLVACLGDAHLAGPAVRFNIRLHSPPPLLTDLPFTVEVDQGGPRLRFEVTGAGGPVLTGWVATVNDGEAVVPAHIVADLAAHATLSEAEQRYLEVQDDPEVEEFAGCFGCGSDNADGLHLRTRPIDGRHAWVDWQPEARWHDGDWLGTLPAIAALDCTSAFPLRQLGVTAENESCLLGTYDGEIHRRPPASMAGAYRIVTAPRRREGRKIWADIGLFSPGGEVFITGCATWIVMAA